MRLDDLTNMEIVRLYREWSEGFWAAGFMEVTPEGLTDFMKWAAIEVRQAPFRDYELDLLEKFHARLLTNPNYTC